MTIKLRTEEPKLRGLLGLVAAGIGARELADIVLTPAGNNTRMAVVELDSRYGSVKAVAYADDKPLNGQDPGSGYDAQLSLTYLGDNDEQRAELYQVVEEVAAGIAKAGYLTR